MTEAAKTSPDAPDPTPAGDARLDPELPARLRAVQVRTDDLLRLRLIFVALMRLAGLVVAVSSVLPIASWLAEGIADDDLWWLGYYWPRIALAVFLAIAGVVLLLLGGVLGRLLVRTRAGKVACPMCRFDLTVLDRGRCTECGYEVNPMLPELGVPPMERVLVVRLGAFAALRLVAFGVLVLSAYALAVFFAKAYLPQTFIMSWEESNQMYLMLLRGSLFAALGITLLLAARPVSALLVPMWWARKLAEGRVDHR